MCTAACANVVQLRVHLNNDLHWPSEIQVTDQMLALTIRSLSAISSSSSFFLCSKWTSIRVCNSNRSFSILFLWMSWERNKHRPNNRNKMNEITVSESGEKRLGWWTCIICCINLILNWKCYGMHSSEVSHLQAVALWIAKKCQIMLSNKPLPCPLAPQFLSLLSSSAFAVMHYRQTGDSITQ